MLPAMRFRNFGKGHCTKDLIQNELTNRKHAKDEAPADQSQGETGDANQQGDATDVRPEGNGSGARQLEWFANGKTWRNEYWRYVGKHDGCGTKWCCKWSNRRYADESEAFA